MGVIESAADDRRIVAVRKDADGDILAIYGPANSWGSRTVAEAADDIDRRGLRYYVQQGTSPRVAVLTAPRPTGTGRYLRTVADAATVNNLDSLPDPGAAGVLGQPAKRLWGARPRYFDRMALRAADLGLEQAALDRQQRRLSRFLHGWGVVCGFEIVGATGASDPETPPDESLRPDQLRIGAGYAITPLGSEVYLPEAVTLEDALCMIPAECRPPGVACGDLSAPEAEPDDLYAAHLIAEPIRETAASRPAMPEGCGHPGNHMEDSRLCAGVALRFVCALGPPHDAPAQDCESNGMIVCGGGAMQQMTVPMPPPLPDGADFVVLASLLVGANGIVEIALDRRRRLLPVEVLQRRLECLCAEPQPTPTVTNTPTFTVTTTPTFTFTTTPTFTFTTTPTFTFSPTPTFTLSATPTFTATLTATFGPTATVFPTGFPGTFGPGDLTQPVPFDPGRIVALDPEIFDVERGAALPVAEVGAVSAAEAAALEAAGVGSAAALHVMETEALTALLGVSPVRAAELKTEAGAAFRRVDAPAGAAIPVREIAGVGATRAARLEAAGFADIRAVAGAGAAEIAEAVGVSESVAAAMIADARSRAGLG